MDVSAWLPLPVLWERDRVRVLFLLCNWLLQTQEPSPQPSPRVPGEGEIPEAIALNVVGVSRFATGITTHAKPGRIDCDAMRPRSWQSLLPVLILALAAALRVYHIADSSFWLDEFCSAECSTGRGLAHVALPRNQWLTNPPLLTTLTGAPAWWHIWTSMGLDNHPPLYFIVLRIWRDMAGESDLAARLLSVLISLAGLVLFYDAVKIGIGKPAALWAMLLAAVAMPQVHFAQEARGYGMLGTLGMAACCALMRIEVLGITRRRWGALALSVLAMLLTHYFAVAGWTALVVYAAISMRGVNRRAVLSALFVAAFIFAISWGPWMLEQRRSYQANNAWQADVADNHLLRTLELATQIPVRWCGEWLTNEYPLVSTVLGLGAFALAIFSFRERRRVWCLWLAAPILLVMCVDLLNRTTLLNSIRYTLAGSWGLYALVAALPRRWLRYVLVTVALGLSLISAPTSYSESRDWSALAQYLQANVQSDDAVVFASAGRDDWYAGAMYMGISHYAKPLPAPMVLLTRPLTADLRQGVEGRRVVWLIAGSQIPADQLLPEVTGFTVEESAAFPDIGKVWKLRRQ